MPLGLITLIAVVVLFGLLAGAFGADTRDGRDWDRHHGRI
jgi:hypothetical protein